MTRVVRGGSGLGDALYVQSVVRHLVARGERPRVMTDWPDVFRPLNGHVDTAPFTRAGVDTVAHYVSRKGVPGTSQFEDACASAGIRERVELRLDWAATDPALVAEVRSRAAGRRIVLIQLMRPPMGRTDGFGASVLPDYRAIQACVDRLRERGTFLVQVGSGERLHEVRGIELDLAGRTTVAQLVDVAQAADAVLGYPSFILPLAESLGKRGLYVWSSRGLRDPKPFISRITPEKVIHRKDLAVVVRDDRSTDQLRRAADALLDAL